MKTLNSETIFARLLGWLARAVIRRRRWVIWPQVVLFAGCVVYTCLYLQFDTSRSNLVGDNERYQRNYLQFKREFPTQDDIVAVVESEDGSKNRQFVERLGAKVEAARIHIPISPGSNQTIETNLFSNIFYKGDLKMLGSKALLFLPENDLAALKKKLAEYHSFIEPFSRTTNLVTLFEMVNKQFATAKEEQNDQTESLVQSLPALTHIVNEATDSMRRTGVPPSPGVTALFSPGDDTAQQEYITFENGRIFLVTAQAVEAGLNADAVKRYRQLVEETRSEVPGVNAGLTGEPVLEHDEMAQSQKDSTLASVVSLILCALIFIYGYQETGRPLKATISLIIGIGYTMAFTTATVGHLNILTITFVPILIGLAIDYGVHLVTRYEEELRHGRTEEEALTRAMVFTGQGIFTGAFTTAGAFLAMGLTDFKGIQEMGIICGGGLLICLIPMMTFLPVLLLRGRQNVLDHEIARVNHRERIENFWLRRPALVLVFTVITCAIAGWQMRRVTFDYNLLNMQSPGLPAVQFEEKLIHAVTSASTNGGGGRAILFAAVVADSEEEVTRLEARIRKLPLVAEVDSIARFSAGNETRKLAMIKEIKESLATIRFSPSDMTPANIPDLSRTLFSLGGYCSLTRDKVQQKEPEIARQLGALRKAIDRCRKKMNEGSPADIDAHGVKLGVFQRALFDDLGATFEALRGQDDREGLRVQDLPSALRNRFVGVTGKQLLQVYPVSNLWERVHQEAFIKQLREALDPDDDDVPIITGTPVQLYEYTSLLKRSYEEAALYSLGAIVILALIHFRTPGPVLLAMVPVGIGSVWLGGIMGWFNIPLNPANIMMLPLIIGIGVTNGIHILNRFAEEQSPSILAKSTGKAVLVSGLTTIAGFGSLALAEHRGIESLGYVMAFGVATCMFAGLTCLPAILNLITRNRSTSETNKSDDVNAGKAPGNQQPG